MYIKTKKEKITRLENKVVEGVKKFLKSKARALSFIQKYDYDCFWVKFILEHKCTVLK